MSEQPMTTIRVKKDAHYFSASNEPFNDKRLSWEARGLMGYLLSKPNDWEVRMSDLENQGSAGNYKIRRMLAELRAYGYMNRIRVSKDGGKFDWITEVYESPSQNPSPSKGFIKTSGGFSTSGSSTCGEPRDILSTDLQSTDKKDLTLTDEEKQQANKKVDLILSFAKKGAGMWKGRELFNDNVLHFADWYFNSTGQTPSKSSKSSWIKAFSAWKDEGLEIVDLESARTARLKWKDFIADPNELTKDAVAIKSQRNILPSEQSRPTGTGFYA